MAKKKSKTTFTKVVPKSFKGLEGVEKSLGKLKLALGGGDVKIHRNADGSVDGEFKIGIGKRVPTEAILLMAQNALPTRLSRTWVSFGFRFSDAGIIRPEDYKRFRGHLLQVGVYDQLAHKSSTNVTTAMKILDTMKRRKIRKPVQVVVRLHWNKRGERPDRPNRRKEAGKGSRKRKRK